MDYVTIERDTISIAQGRRIVDMANKIALLQSDKTPLLALTQALGQKRIVTNPKFEWMEDELKPYTTQINNAAGYTDADTALIVDEARIFAVNDIVLVERTKEPMLVTAIDTATNTITVTRNYRDTGAAAAINDNDILRIVGNAYAEFAGKQIESTTKISIPYNYTQIFRTAFGASETLNNSELYGGKDMAWMRFKKGIEHAVKIEQSAFFGSRNQDLTGSHPRRATGGLTYYLNANIKDVGGAALTESIFDEWLRDIFRYGSSKKVLFASPLLCSAINSWSKNKLMTDVNDTVYGVKVMTYVNVHGDLKVINCKETLRGEFGAYGFALQLDQIRPVALSGRDTKLKTNIQANDEDGEIDEYISEIGWEIKSPKVHGYIYNFT